MFWTHAAPFFQHSEYAELPLHPRWDLHPYTQSYGRTGGVLRNIDTGPSMISLKAEFFTDSIAMAMLQVIGSKLNEHVSEGESYNRIVCIPGQGSMSSIPVLRVHHEDRHPYSVDVFQDGEHRSEVNLLCMEKHHFFMCRHLAECVLDTFL